MVKLVSIPPVHNLWFATFLPLALKDNLYQHEMEINISIFIQLYFIHGLF